VESAGESTIAKGLRTSDTESALPAISSGTPTHSTTLRARNTAVAANDISGIQLETAVTAKFAELDIQCNQQDGSQFIMVKR